MAPRPSSKRVQQGLVPTWLWTVVHCRNQKARTRTLLYVGLGAAGAGTDLVRLAELLGSPVATTIQGKGVFPESHPLFLWNGFGRSAPPFARKIAAQCDRMLAIGCRFSEVGTAGYGLELPGPLCHVDINAEVLGRNFPAEAFQPQSLADLPHLWHQRPRRIRQCSLQVQ